MKETAEAARLFEYSDNDYNHLDDDDLNEDKRQIKNADSKKRVKVGCHQGNLVGVFIVQTVPYGGRTDR